MSTSSSAVRLPVVPTAASECSTRAVQLLWFALLRHPWRSLVVVPVDTFTPAWRFGERLVSVAAGLGFRVELVDARRAVTARPGATAASPSADGKGVRHFVSPNQVSDTSWVADSEPVRTLTVVDPPEEHPAALVRVSSADAVALCLSLGTTRLSDAERVLALCGLERTLGAIVLDEREASRGDDGRPPSQRG
jgi:hypothetical protein